MKHPKNVIILLLLYFLIIQVFSVLLITKYYSTVENYTAPSNESAQGSLNWFIILFLLVTIAFIILSLKKFRKPIMFWTKISIIVAFYLTLTLVFSILKFPQLWVDLLAIIFAILLYFVRKTSLRNLTEAFMYAGFVAMILPLFNFKYLIILLIILSIYDFISVRITKHMILMANSQMEVSSFSGLQIDYNPNLEKNENLKEEINFSNVSMNKEINDDKIYVIKKVETKSAILGGGDIAFPMILASYMAINFGWIYGISVILGSLIGLTLIFKFSEKDKFYPAIPYLTFLMFLSLTLTKLFL
ncbi:MAG: presenilin family intramembrane aspartyl protease [Candidatus Woesearchaeota archaeon]